MRLLLTIAVYANLQSDVLCQAPARPQPDGAPGENIAPGEVGERFAQVGKQDTATTDDVAEEDSSDPPDEDDPRSQRNLDNIDFRAPINRSKQTAWQKIERAAQGRGWDEVLQRLDRFVGPADGTSSEDYVIRNADGRVESARLSIARLLASMPENIRVARARSEATLGKTLLDRAIQENSLRQLNHVAVRFFGTLAGYEAADRLAAQLIDRGEFALAARWLKLLLDSDAQITRSPAWQKKSSVILDLTSRPQKTKTLTETLQTLRTQFVSSEPAQQTQWPVPGGNARRHAEPNSASRPVMIRRWEFPTTSNSTLKLTLERLLSDLAYRSVPTIPAATPIFVDGKIVCRTFRGIEVLDVETGQHLWTTAESASVERLLGSASPDARSVSDLTLNMTPLLSAGAAVDRTGGPIGQFLFQNAAHGLISSDRKRVYFLEDDPVFTLGRTSIRRVNGGNAAPRPDSTTSNRLKAYELENGEPSWQIGGQQTDEPFAPDLAGWFFLGAPLPDRGDLFVVGQRENVIRLFCLDPESGSARWSQQIAFAEEGLERNLNRRLWSLQLAIAHGIVVCPTSVGWLVGVDRSTGTIVWSHRYSERRLTGLTGSPRLFRRNRGGVELANEPIGDTWIPSAPIIMGDRVVYAPAEALDEDDNTTRFLDCVNVFTGERIWSLPRKQAFAVCGATHGQTVVTWPNSIVILNPDGQTRAEIQFDSADGLPSGRGIVANGSFWLPLQKNVLLRFDLEQAKLAERIELAAGYPPLGNLSFYKGLLISHAPEGVTAWELEETLDARLATIRSSGDDSSADILETQLALCRKDYSAAIEILLPRLSANPDTILHESILQLLMQAAAGQVKTKPEKALTLLTQVQPIFDAAGVEGASFERQRRQLEFEALLEMNRLPEAFEKLLDIATTPASGLVKRFDNSAVTTSIDAWLARRFRIVWDQLATADQTRIAPQITKLFKQTESSRTSGLTPERFAALFDFHPESQKLAQQQSKEAVADLRFIDAEHWLNQIEQSAPTDQAVDALLRRLQLRIDLSIADPDTHELARRLEKDFTSTQLPDGTAMSIDLKPLLEKLARSSTPATPDWGKISLTGTRTAASQQQKKNPRLVADRPSNRFRIEAGSSETGSNRISFFDRTSNELYWTVSLRSNNASRTNTNSGQRLTIYQTGQLYSVLSRGVLNMLSLPERRVLWTEPVDELDNARRSPTKRGRPLEDIDEWLLRRRPGSMNSVPVINSSYVCSRATRSLAIFDARTGKLRWRLEPLDRSLRVFGTRDTVYLTRPDGTISAAHHAIDGQPLGSEEFSADVSESKVVVQVDEHSIVTAVNSINNGDNDDEAVVRFEAYAPDSKTRLWSHEFSTKIKVRMISNDQLAILARFGRIKLLNFRTGTLTEFEKILPKHRIKIPEFTIFSDGKILYVILKRDTSTEVRQPGLPSVRLSGHLIAFDVSTGKQLWMQELPEQHLILERLDQLPFLITTSYRREFIRQPPEVRRIIVLDKRDGNVLLDTKDEPGEAAFHSLVIDTENQYVDLHSTNERYRLQATPVTK